jgi:hypothetical protein
VQPVEVAKKQSTLASLSWAARPVDESQQKRLDFLLLELEQRSAAGLQPTMETANDRTGSRLDQQVLFSKSGQ